jgi:hypothetical protein
MPISISGSNLTDGFNNTVPAPPYGSLSFNGINQGIVTSGTGSGSTNSALDLATGTPSYTIEFWFYSNQISTPSNAQYILNQGNATTINFQLVNGNNSYLTFGTQYLQASFNITAVGTVNMSSWPTTIAVNTWYHVALCRDTTNGNRYYLYLNGVLVSSTYNIGTPVANNGQGFDFGFPLTLNSSPIYSFNGYLSNMRIVKGVSVYVPLDVTVPTPPLASTQSLNLSGYNQAITGTQTSLLLTAPYTNVPGSIVLPNTTTVTYPSSSVYNFASNDFTIEFFAYFTTLADIGYVFENWGGIGNRNFRVGFLGPTYTGEAGVYRPRFVDGNFTGISPATSSTSNLTTGIWYHIAFVNFGGTFKLYVNGIADATTASGLSFVTSNSTLAINTAFAVSWRLSQLRIVNGTAVYTSNFTPPTSILTSTQSANTNGYPSAAITGTQTAILLNAVPGANFLVDSSSNNFTPTPSVTAPTSASGGPTFFDDSSSYDQLVSGINFPTSSVLGPSTYLGSVLFNGTNQYLTVPAATQFNYSTNDFTWEMWIYPTSATWTSTTFYLIDHGPAANQGTLHYSSNKLVYYSYYNANTTPPYTAGIPFPSLYYITGGPITANTWTHIALCRQNLVTNMFINGKVVSSGPDPYDYAFASGSPITYPPISPATQSVTIGARTDGSYVFKGNISNVRIVNGVSVYNVGNFTPPVRPLPQVQGLNVIGIPSKPISGTQTSLLMNSSYTGGFLSDSSFNGVTITQQTIGSFPPSTYTMTSNSTSPFNSNGSIFTPGSIFFNGTSQYLTVPDNAALQLSTGTAFTIEAWIYPTDLSAADHGIVAKRSAGSAEWQFNIHPSNGYLTFWNGTTTYQSDISLSVNNWYHVAVTWDTTTLRFFVNGLIGTTYTGLTLTPGNNTLTIGAVYANTGLYTGNISNLRIVNGTAVYTQNFIPTVGPFTTSQTFNQSGIPSCPVQSSQTELLLITPSNSSYLTDSSTNAFTVTNVGTATSTPFNPFTGNYEILSNPGSILFNGTTQYLNTAASTALTLTGDFTIECWFYDTNIAANESLYGKRPDSATYGGVSLYHVGDGNLSFLGTTTGSTWEIQFNSTIATPANQWHHVAVTRLGNVYTIWVNGQSAGTQTVAGAILANSTIPFTIGAGSQIGTTPWSGYISNFRVVNGVAVYTSAFTPPVSPLNNSQAANQSGVPSAAVTNSQTSLLLNTAFGTNFLVDGSINNFTVTNVGTAISATLDPF